MRQPHIQISNGAWIFASAVALGAILSGGAYAVSNSIVAIGNANGTTTAYVTPTRQLQTVVTAPTNLVTANGAVAVGSCAAVYTPPAGKAIVVTQITYDLGTGTQGTESAGGMEDASCNGHVYDFVDTIQAHETQAHTFPTGLPLAGVGVYNSSFGSDLIFVSLTGYLIPATQLPSERRGVIKG